jgi:hypothetical protein
MRYFDKQVVLFEFTTLSDSNTWCDWRGTGLSYAFHGYSGQRLRPVWPNFGTRRLVKHMPVAFESFWRCRATWGLWQYRYGALTGNRGPDGDYQSFESTYILVPWLKKPADLREKHKSNKHLHPWKWKEALLEKVASTGCRIHLSAERKKITLSNGWRITSRNWRWPEYRKTRWCQRLGSF